MALHFSRVGPATGELEMWNASERGFSFVISYNFPVVGIMGKTGVWITHPEPNRCISIGPAVGFLLDIQDNSLQPKAVILQCDSLSMLFFRNRNETPATFGRPLDWSCSP
jgi:hypothetical protein